MIESPSAGEEDPSTSRVEGGGGEGGRADMQRCDERVWVRARGEDVVDEDCGCGTGGEEEWVVGVEMQGGDCGRLGVADVLGALNVENFGTKAPEFAGCIAGLSGV